MITYVYNMPDRYEEQLAYEVSLATLPGYIQVIGKGVNVDVQFENALTVSDKTVLDLILSNHVPDTNWERLDSVIVRKQIAITQLQALRDSLASLIRAVAISAALSDNTLRRQVIGGAQATWNPASMVNNTGVTSPPVTVAGALFGDIVEVSIPYSPQGLIVYGYVDAANTVRIRLHNGTGSTIDLASGIWKVLVKRPEVLPQLTVDDAKNAVINRVNLGD